MYGALRAAGPYNFARALAYLSSNTKDRFKASGSASAEMFVRIGKR
jgi:hypothetical protein